MLSPSVGWLVCHTFGFPFCQRLWALTKRWDDIVVADIEVDMVADMAVDMVAELDVDMVADMEVDMVADMEVNMVSDKFFQAEPFVSPNFFKPNLIPACVSSKICEFIE